METGIAILTRCLSLVYFDAFAANAASTAGMTCVLARVGPPNRAIKTEGVAFTRNLSRRARLAIVFVVVFVRGLCLIAVELSRRAMKACGVGLRCILGVEASGADGAGHSRVIREFSGFAQDTIINIVVSLRAGVTRVLNVVYERAPEGTILTLHVRAENGVWLILSLRAAFAFKRR